MHIKSRFVAATAAAALAAGPVQAATVSDPVGDFLPSFIGPNDADLDVVSFSVDYNAGSSLFSLGAVLAGAINPARAGLYVIGVNTGTGLIAPFGNIGQPNVVFNQAIVIRKDGSGAIGGTTLDPSTITIAGNVFTVRVPLSLLPTTGFAPGQYGFNLWPRNGLGNNNQISDFAPNNALLATAPEPATWSLLILGFGLVGAGLRQRKPARPHVRFL